MFMYYMNSFNDSVKEICIIFCCISCLLFSRPCTKTMLFWSLTWKLRTKQYSKLVTFRIFCQFQQDYWNNNRHSPCNGRFYRVRRCPGYLLSAHAEKGASRSGCQTPWSSRLPTEQHRRVCQ